MKKTITKNNKKSEKEQKIQKIQKNKRLKRVAAICTLPLLLSGCTPSLKTDMEFYKDGTGDISMNFLLPDSVYKAEDKNNENIENNETVENVDNVESVENSDTVQNNEGIKENDETDELFTKKELKGLLETRFKDFTIKEIADDNMTGFAISADYNNKQLQSFIDSVYTVKTSGIGNKFSLEFSLDNFIPVIAENGYYNSEIDQNTDSPSDEDSFIESNKDILLSNSLTGLKQFIDFSTDLEMTLSITMPGEITTCNLVDFDGVIISNAKENTVDINFGKYIKEYGNSADFTNTIKVESKKLGGSVFKLVMTVGAGLVILITYKFVQKVNQGPFSN